MTPMSHNHSALDRPLARVAAGLVLVAALAVIGWHHRDDLFPPEGQSASDGNPAFERCVTRRFADIDKMVAEGLVDQGQAGLFKQRAEGMCRDMTPR